mmetsp:Transcript_39319/g.155969  ORF Transcript_39319/g.155969 Transcript_39319/m.155969 type:complete len:476 (-) Transcript_39319:5743-7170(-)
MLMHYGIVPVVVFDGDRLPMKFNEESERKRRREANLTKGKEALKEGRNDEAQEFFKRALDVTPQMAFEVIKMCKQLGVEFLVAPYEADAQLAYMSINGKVAAVISEDSDLFVYGVSKLILKLDKYGEAELLDSDKLRAMKDPDFTYFTREMVVFMCVLSGCDFFPGVKGVGLRTAHSVVRRYKSFDRLVRMFRYSHKYRDIPENFENGFRKATLVFSHQRVFDPERRKLVHLREVNEMVTVVEDDPTMSFLGPDLLDKDVCMIADGLIDPHTREEFVDAVDTAVVGAKRPFPVNGQSGRRVSRPIGNKLNAVSRLSTIDKFVQKMSRDSPEASLVKPFRAPRRTNEEDRPTKDRRKLFDYFSKLSREEAKPAAAIVTKAAHGDGYSKYFEKLTPAEGKTKSFSGPLVSDSQSRISMSSQVSDLRTKPGSLDGFRHFTKNKLGPGTTGRPVGHVFTKTPDRSADKEAEGKDVRVKE